MPKDTTTRFQGVYARYRKGCSIERGSRCSCKPSYWGKAWDRGAGRSVKTAMLATPSAASNARGDLIEELKRGKTPTPTTIRLAKAADLFIASAQDGVALNKHGRRYKPSAVRDLEGSLRSHVTPTLGFKRIGDVRRGDCQQLVDQLTPTMSGSRVRSVVNAIRSGLPQQWQPDRRSCFWRIRGPRQASASLGSRYSTRTRATRSSSFRGRCVASLREVGRQTWCPPRPEV
jgi:hypothetical protein